MNNSPTMISGSGPGNFRLHQAVVVPRGDLYILGRIARWRRAGEVEVSFDDGSKVQCQQSQLIALLDVKTSPDKCHVVREESPVRIQSTGNIDVKIKKPTRSKARCRVQVKYFGDDTSDAEDQMLTWSRRATVRRSVLSVQHIIRDLTPPSQTCPSVESARSSPSISHNLADVESDLSDAPRKPASPLPSAVDGDILRSRQSDLPYKFDLLRWDDCHLTNVQGQYCYCGQNGTWFKKMIQCSNCHQWYHQECLINSVPSTSSMLLGDQFFEFLCALCAPKSGVEMIRCLDMAWRDAIHLVMFNLTIGNRKKFHDIPSSVLPFVQRHWSSLRLSPAKVRVYHPSRISSEFILQLFISNKQLFMSSSETSKSGTFWALRNLWPPLGPLSTARHSESPLPPIAIAVNSHTRQSDRKGRKLDSEAQTAVSLDCLIPATSENPFIESTSQSEKQSDVIDDVEIGSEGYNSESGQSTMFGDDNKVDVHPTKGNERFDFAELASSSSSMNVLAKRLAPDGDIQVLIQRSSDDVQSVESS